ncbi:TIGR03087 family PEP-CTERM/XrtA system glycosyltransferase [Motilimonas pumila]|uniref:TIGR03087 family PEP-CTERM/XrtA system glycosyltransferase n=1 Tax=Motilimonas pumila TaxID=2303987 RepID=A0A418YH81_9GAMM|nr:TIGR03087 family PEP-CTERM/XrtA system glycosyltransferase [Motilimonas pumila]RJG49462.1 TIGR03087 family PEP-CTERM/XrtA system glycosyltransferase [Motilimonas pumila]
MEKVLFLCHRIPFPPNKGDKIRSYHWLQYLKQHYQVFLGAFVDDKQDWQHQEQVSLGTQDCQLMARHPWLHKAKSLTALLGDQPLSLAYYQSDKMQAWVDAILAEHPDIKVLTFSSSMAQYVPDHAKFAVMDFVDIDSDKWLQYAEKKQGFMAWLYQREFRTLQRYEQQVAQRFDLSLFVSAAEADEFQRKQSKHIHSSIDWVQNGVDIHYFNPDDPSLESPYPAAKPCIVFTGAMDYWANVEGVTWFTEQVWPSLLAARPDCLFYIVGSNPGAEVLRLQQLTNVVVTGRVPDIRPYLKFAQCVVAPLRISRGIQNKVLEALAMNQIVVGSPDAFVGIGQSQSTLVAEDAGRFSEHCLAQLSQPLQQGRQPRAWVEERFSWQSSFDRLGALIAQAGG